MAALAFRQNPDIGKALFHQVDLRQNMVWGPVTLGTHDAAAAFIQ